MSKKGLSVDEKRSRMLDLFHETKDFYKLTDLEKIAPKSKGITQQTVKETLQSLVDDNLVSFDKVGVSNFYWAFPSAAGQTFVQEQEKRKKAVEGLENEVGQLGQVIEKERVGREETDERRTLISQMDVVRSKIADLEKEKLKYSNSDLAMNAQRELEIVQLQKSALMYTEKVSTALAYIRNMDGEDAITGLQAELGIGEDWDDLAF